MGERYTHGHLFDFYKSLSKNPQELTVLGNGKQRKSYLYVEDCVRAIETALTLAEKPVNIFNLGTDEYIEVNDSIKWVGDYLGLHPKISYTGGDRGWIGDNPFIFLDCSRIRNLGWAPKLSIKEAAVRTLTYFDEFPSVLERA
jgi:UDP-glucose 4-epimerase